MSVSSPTLVHLPTGTISILAHDTCPATVGASKAPQGNKDGE